MNNFLFEFTTLQPKFFLFEPFFYLATDIVFYVFCVRSNLNVFEHGRFELRTDINLVSAQKSYRDDGVTISQRFECTRYLTSLLVALVKTIHYQTCIFEVIRHLS